MSLTPLFRILLAAALVALLPQSALAQKVVELEGELYVIGESNGSRTNTNTPFTPFEEVFGNDSEQMALAHFIAETRSATDSFRWEEKFNLGSTTTNSCWDAANNFSTAMSRQLDDGYQVRMIGRLGALTDIENRLGDAILDRDINWDYDPLDPPSYDHTLSVIRTPDGDYFTVDNWHGDVIMKRLYPIDDEGKFFSERPGETDVANASFRLHRTELLNPWDDDFETPEEDEERSPSPIPTTSEPVDVEVLTSADPNDKTGLLGVAEERYITPEGRARYLIRFENMPEASAPAQEVLIRDTLDTDAFDLSTFELGTITFDDRRIPVPPGRSSFSARVPLGGLASGDGPFELLVSASLVPATGIVTWRFTTLDTQTNDLPFDPLDGFLPPNQAPPEGEGSVAFSVDLRETLGDGDVVRNQARIIFDLNEPIDTPPWVNVIDLAPPASAVTLDETQADSVFTVRWEGTDGGSGVRHYDVYLSIDGGPFQRWLQQYPFTEETFVGEDGATYAFYSIAYDATGNVEPEKTEPDAVTAVVVGTEDEATLPERVTLTAPYPNPATGAMTVPFGLPAAGAAEIEVFDLLGRRVALLATGDHPAGWHSLRWDLGRVASGVYVLRLRADGVAETRRVTVVR